MVDLLINEAITLHHENRPTIPTSPGDAITKDGSCLQQEHPEEVFAKVMPAPYGSVFTVRFDLRKEGTAYI